MFHQDQTIIHYTELGGYQLLRGSQCTKTMLVDSIHAIDIVVFFSESRYEWFYCSMLYFYSVIKYNYCTAAPTYWPLPHMHKSLNEGG